MQQSFCIFYLSKWFIKQKMVLLSRIYKKFPRQIQHPYFAIFDSLKIRWRPVGISATSKITDPKFTIARANFVPSPCQIELPHFDKGVRFPFVEGWGANATLSRSDETRRVGSAMSCLVRFLNEIILQCGRRAGGGFMRAVITKGRLVALLCWGAAIVWDIYFYRQFNWGLRANLSLGIWLLLYWRL